MEQKLLPDLGESRRRGSAAQAARSERTLRGWGLPGAGTPGSAVPGIPAAFQPFPRALQPLSPSPHALIPSPHPHIPSSLPLSPSKGLLGRRGRSSVQLLIYSSYFNRLLESTEEAAGQRWAQLAQRFLLTAPSQPSDRSPRTAAARSPWLVAALGVPGVGRHFCPEPAAASSGSIQLLFGIFPPPPLGFTGISLCRRSSGGGSEHSDSPAAGMGQEGSDQPCRGSRPLQSRGCGAGPCAGVTVSLAQPPFVAFPSFYIFISLICIAFA